MNRTLYICIAAVAVLASCRKPETVPDGKTGDRDAISLGMKLPAAGVTRGLGPLDDWNQRQKVYVYGIARKTTKDPEGKDLVSVTDLEWPDFYIDNVPVLSLPERSSHPGAKNEIEVLNEKADYAEPYYYTPSGRFEFFGYSVDDAIVKRDTDNRPVPAITADRLELPIKIDGSQDILAAVTDKDSDNTPGLLVDRIYSAYSARRGVVPNLIFQHQLSRFNIYVKSGDRYDATHDLHLADIDTLGRIEVSSKTEATLVIANRVTNDLAGFSIGNGLDAATFNTPEWIRVHVKPDPDSPAHPLSLEDKIQPSRDWSTSFVGSVLVMPGESSYTFRLGMNQDGYTVEPDQATKDRYSYREDKKVYDIETEFVVDFERLLPKGQDPKYNTGASEMATELDKVAVAGHQYDVNVVVYGLQEVRVTVSLTEWEDGGSALADKDPDSGIQALSVLADDMDVYVGEDYVKKVNATLSSGETEGIEYRYEIEDETIATVDREGFVRGWTPGEVKLLIVAEKYTVDESSARVLAAKGQKTITVKVLPAPLTDPELKFKKADGTLVASGSEFVWNIKTGGMVLDLLPEWKGPGALKYTIPAQSQKLPDGTFGDVLTYSPDGHIVTVACDVPEGTPGSVPEATADIEAWVEAAGDYGESARYVIHVIIINR